jgi:hypothetical protein
MTYKSEASRFEMSVLRMALSDTDSVSSWVTCGKKTPRSEVLCLCTQPVHGYRIQHLKLDGRIGEQYLVGGLVEQLSGIPVT